MKPRSLRVVQEHPSDWWMRGRQAIISSLLRSKSKKGKIVDIGAGVGYMSASLRDLGFSDILAADQSTSALAYLAKKGFRTARISLPEVKISGAFDHILLLDVLEHVEDDVLTLKNLRPLLSNRGEIIITVPAFPFLWSQKDEEVLHKRRYLRRELSSKLEQAGYNLDYISYYNFFLFLPAVVFSYMNKKQKRAKRYNSFLDKFFYPIFSAEKHFIANGLRFPFGVSLIAIAHRDGK